MQDNTIIKSTTIRLPKSTLDSIKIYCRKKGQPVGEWAEKAWRFIEKNDFDIYDLDATPCLPVPPEVEKERTEVGALCRLMKDFILSQTQNQLPAPDTITRETAEVLANITAEKGKAEGKAEVLADQLAQIKEEVAQLRSENAALKSYQKKAHTELLRIKEEQRFLGKIDVFTEF